MEDGGRVCRDRRRVNSTAQNVRCRRFLRFFSGSSREALSSESTKRNDVMPVRVSPLRGLVTFEFFPWKFLEPNCLPGPSGHSLRSRGCWERPSEGATANSLQEHHPRLDNSAQPTSLLERKTHPAEPTQPTGAREIIESYVNI